MNPQRKFYLVLPILIIAFLAMIFWLMPVLLGAVKSAGLDLAEKKQILETMRYKESLVSAADKSYQRIKPDFDKINSGLLDRSNILDFIMVIEETARKTGNKCDIKAKEQDSGGKDSIAVNFQVSTAGSFPNFVRFVKDLETMSYFSEIDTIQIQRMSQTRQGEIANTGDVGANLNMRVYLR